METLLSILHWNESLLLAGLPAPSVAPSEPGWWGVMLFPNEDTEHQAGSSTLGPRPLLPPLLSETGSCAAGTELSQDQLFPSRRASYSGGTEGHRYR